MEFPAALDASPELIWLFGTIVLGIILALTMVCVQRPGTRQRRNNARDHYARDNADE